MSQQIFSRPPVDHHIQADIVHRLFIAEHPCTFTDLKSDELENSLFMYHLRKLITSGIVIKQADGYSLTPKGARWVNYYGGNGLQFSIRPILLTQFVALHNNKILLAKRRGSVEGALSLYLLPGERHQYAHTAQTSLDALLARLNLAASAKTFVTVLESIVTSPDEYTHHTIAHIFNIETEATDEFSTDKYTYSWHPVQDVISQPETYGTLLCWFMTQLSQNAVKPVECIKLG